MFDDHRPRRPARANMEIFLFLPWSDSLMFTHPTLGYTWSNRIEL